MPQRQGTAPGRPTGADAGASSADTRARILDAAADAIASEGVADVRMATIARRAGVSTALLHYHFATKDHLFEQVLERSYASYSAPRAADDRRPAPERLLAYLEGCLPLDDTQRRDLLLWQEFTAMAPRHPEMARATAAYFRDDVVRVTAIVEDGAADGDFDVDDAGLAALASIALVDGLCARVLAHDPELTLASARQVLRTSLAVLLRTPDPEAFAAPASAPPVPPQSRGTHRTREAAR